MDNFSVQALSREDARYLPHFLALAAHEESSDNALQKPDLARYVSDWGRTGDCGVAASTAEGQLIGLAWGRLWNEEDPGFGYVDELTPEISIAVEEDFRNQGVGTALIDALKCRLRALKLAARWDARHQKMVPIRQRVEVPQPEMEISPSFVSLSVRADSPACAFYEQCGFALVAGSDRVNRVGGVSQIWRASLNEDGDWRSGTMDRSVNTNWAGAPDDFVSINFYYDLRFSLFDENDWARFYELMRSLPGRDAVVDELEMEGVDEATSWMYFGSSPVKAAIHWSHLGAYLDGALHMSGDLQWDEWCAWETAFDWPAHGLPHGLKQDESPELRELRAALQMTEDALVRDREENRKMRLRLRKLGETAFG